MKKITNWFKSLSRRNKVIFIAVCIVLLGAMASNTNSSFKNGEGEITHYTAKDWDKDAMYKGLASDVLEFTTSHPDAKKLTLIIVDECTDDKGNKSNHESKLVFNQTEIEEFAEYKDADSFNENCTTFGYRLMTDWHPCGSSNY